MKLTLIVVEAPEQSNMLQQTKIFDSTGSVGRSDKSDWVLPDPKRVLSSSHFTIKIEGNQCRIIDTSTNGTSINEPSNLLAKQNPQAIQNGDVIILGEYKLKAVIESSQPSPTASPNESFLDSSDKTTFATTDSANRSQTEKSAEELDRFLNTPSSPPSGFDMGGDDWSNQGFKDDFGFSSNAGAMSPEFGKDPFTNSNSGGFSSSNQDFGFGNQKSPNLPPQHQWENNSDWWREDEDGAHHHSSTLNDAAPKFTVQQDHQSTANKNFSIDDFDAFLNPHSEHPSQDFPTGIDDKAPNFGDSFSGFDEQTSDHFDSPPAFTGGALANDSWATPNTDQSAHSDAPSNLAPPIPQTQPKVNQPSNPPRDPWDDFNQQQPQQQSDWSNPNGGWEPINNPAQPSSEPSSGWGQPINPHEMVKNASWQQPVQTPRAEEEWNTGAGRISNSSGRGDEANQHHPQPTHSNASNTTSVNTGTAQELAKLLSLNWNNVSRKEEFVEDNAEMIKETIQNLMDLLHARDKVKNELRVQRTILETVNNNPLKFTTDPNMALSILFEKQSGSYLSPRETVEDSFSDLADHQVAVLAGVRSACDAMLKYFQPENLERIFKNKGGIFAKKSSQNWESFEAHYSDLMQDTERTKNNLFYNHFADAYEQQLSELKNARTFNNKNRNS